MSTTCIPEPSTLRQGRQVGNTVLDQWSWNSKELCTLSSLPACLNESIVRDLGVLAR